jgi:hypothetical protein
MAIMDMYDKISLAIDKCEFALGIFIDLSKAFDTLNHVILLKKLEHYGIRGVALDLIESYLVNRFQYVSFNDNSSGLKRISCGVPQGSILGPLLFLVYINDIINCSDIMKFILFADDTNLFFSGDDLWKLMSSVNTELIKLSDWFKSNKLSLNIKKTNYIIFGNKKIPKSLNQFQLSIDGNILEQVENTKFLGVYIDNKLNWSRHIEHVALKIAKSLGVMNRVRNVLPYSILLTLYHTLVYPYLTYCNIIWGCAKPSLLNRLVVLQKRAVRLITRSCYCATTGPLFVRLNLLKLSEIYKFQIALFIFKYKQHLLPASCSQYLSVNSNRAYITRRNDYFKILSFRTNIRERCISVSGPRLWNSFPLAIQDSLHLGSFKKELIFYFISLYDLNS